MRAARALRAGRLVVVPTETVYGLAADVFRPAAIRKIFELKGRPLFDPLIVHVGDMSQLAMVAGEVPPLAQKLMLRFWPGPLTFVLIKADVVSPLVTAGLPTVAVRMPAHPVALDILREAGRPFAAPSANRFGRISPTTAEAVCKEFGRRTPFLVDGGPCRCGVESTIIRVVGGRVEILRHGAISQEELASAAGCPVVALKKSVLKNPQAPGQLKRHYAPRTPLFLLPRGWRNKKRHFSVGDALLLFCSRENVPIKKQVILSTKGSLKAAARRLYAALRALDESGAERIFAERFPDEGLGRTLNDRLEKAAAGSGAARQSHA